MLYPSPCFIATSTIPSPSIFPFFIYQVGHVEQDEAGGSKKKQEKARINKNKQE
jgi:hypothetical protein